MEITTTVKQHDNFQLEFKTVYPIHSEQKISEYNTDVFFFIPRNLAVNKYTFSGHEFYNDFSEYIRFKTPDFSLKTLVDPANTAMTRLLNAAESLDKNREDFDKCLKMFCSILKSSLRDSCSEIKNNESDNIKEAVTGFLSDSAVALKNFRILRSYLKECPEKLQLFELADEFLSLTANRYAYELWRFFSEKYPADKEIEKIVAQSAYSEIKYRREHKYNAVPDSEGDNSELLYRESTLKKVLANILFLNVETKRDGMMLENIFMAFAAAVAMIFVTAVAFIWKGLYLEEFSFSFFAIWVIAYMFKDRIKSQLQLYFLSKRSRYSYDYRQKIFDGFGNEIGVFREGFRHCNGKDIDERISQVRNRTMISRLVNGSQEENVIVYRKKIELKGDSCKDIFQEFNVEGVVNIYRMNVRHWLNKMDNPVRNIYCADGENIMPISAHRDYHVNIIMRIGGKNCREQYIRYRLILCRDGIRKLIKF